MRPRSRRWARSARGSTPSPRRLSSLISGGSLFSQPSLSDSSVFTATALPGARLGGLSASIEVDHLAQAQTLSSAPLAARTDPIGQGDLTLTMATGSFVVSITAANDSLDGLARAINDAGAGVTASVVTDISGARLVLKGATGAANAFTLSVPNGTASGLERFAFGPGVTGGMTEAQAAVNAALTVDGVAVERATNSFSDLIAGVQIDLKRGAPGTLVAMGVTRPTAGISQGVADFVAAYNELVAMISTATAAGVDGEAGPLRGDLGVAEMKRRLSQLSTMALSSEGDGPHTLAEIGVRTNRDGTMALDASRLQAVLASDPDGVEALFNPSQRSSSAMLEIKSLVGKVKPGVYTITNVVPAPVGGDASGDGRRPGDARRGRQPRRALDRGGAWPRPRRQWRGGERDDHDRFRPWRRPAGDPRFAARPQRAVRRLAATGSRPKRAPSPRTARRSRPGPRNITISC